MRDAGMTSTQFVVATGFALVVFVVLANLVVDLYARGAVRAAVDEGVRAGAPIDGSPAQCAARARDVLDGLLGGELASGVHVTCTEGEGAVSARAEVRLRSWLGLVPDWSFAIVGTAVKEREP